MLVSSEFISSETGLGYLIFSYGGVGAEDAMLAVVLYLAALGYLLDAFTSPACASHGLACIRALRSDVGRARAVRVVRSERCCWRGSSSPGWAWVNPYVFPPVSEILLRWFALFADGDDVRSARGYAVARAAGPLHGDRDRRSRRPRDGARARGGVVPRAAVLVRLPLPKIALIPLYVSWFGLFSLSKVMLIFTDCLFPIVIFTYHGAQGLSPIYLWSAQARGTGRVRMFWRVVLPLSLASIYDGVQVAVVVAVLVAVVTEMVSGGSGLGDDDDPRLSLRRRAHRVRHAADDFADRLRPLPRSPQALRERLLFWHVTEA